MIRRTENLILRSTLSGRSVSAGLVDALVRFAQSRGADRDGLLAGCELCETDLLDLDLRVPFERYVALTRSAAERVGDPAFALHFGAAVELGDISIVGLIGLASRSMPEALSQLNRYGRLVIETDLGTSPRFGNKVGPDGIWMTDQRENPNDFPELTETTFARMIYGVRRFAPQLKVHAVDMTHAAPGHADEVAQVLGAPVRFSADRNAFQIDQDWLTLELNLQPRYAFGVFARHADALLEGLEASRTMRGRVEARLMPILHTGDARIEHIAAELGMSRQTLYRRLKAENTSFEAVLDALRHRLALDYLGSRKISVHQAAYLVGFSDPAAFSRAFKRWTGKSPGATRGKTSGSPQTGNMPT
jgi:AraC-like DNA-binding protein